MSGRLFLAISPYHEGHNDIYNHHQCPVTHIRVSNQHIHYDKTMVIQMMDNNKKILNDFK